MGNLRLNVVPNGFHGSGAVNVGSAAVATVGQHSRDVAGVGITAMGLRGPIGGYRELTVAYLNSADENVSLTIQNTSTVPITVTANYYGEQSGSLVLSWPVSGLQPGHSVELLPGSGIPTAFRGSVWVRVTQATGRAAVTVQQSLSDDNGYGYSVP